MCCEASPAEVSPLLSPLLVLQRCEMWLWSVGRSIHSRCTQRLPDVPSASVPRRSSPEWMTALLRHGTCYSVSGKGKESHKHGLILPEQASLLQPAFTAAFWTSSRRAGMHFWDCGVGVLGQLCLCKSPGTDGLRPVAALCSWLVQALGQGRLLGGQWEPEGAPPWWCGHSHRAALSSALLLAHWETSRGLLAGVAQAALL